MPQGVRGLDSPRENMSDLVQFNADLDNKNRVRMSSDNLGIAVHPVLDRHGLPLVPQPTSHADDPLVSIKNS